MYFIDALEPEASCVLLEEFTEVVIAPKQRQQSLPPKMQQTNPNIEQTDSDCKRSNSTPENENTSSFYKLWNYFFTSEKEESSLERTTCSQKSTDKTTEEYKRLSTNSQFNCCRMSFTDKQINICLRTQSEFTQKENQNELKIDGLFSHQLSCIFVNPESIGLNSFKCSSPHKPLCTSDFHGWCKVVLIRKLLSPKEKSELLNIERRKSSKDVEKETSNSTTKLG